MSSLTNVGIFIGSAFYSGGCRRADLEKRVLVSTLDPFRISIRVTDKFSPETRDFETAPLERGLVRICTRCSREQRGPTPLLSLDLTAPTEASLCS